MLSKFSRYGIITEIEGWDRDCRGLFVRGEVREARRVIVESIRRLICVGGVGWS